MGGCGGMTVGRLVEEDRQQGAGEAKGCEMGMDEVGRRAGAGRSSTVNRQFCCCQLAPSYTDTRRQHTAAVAAANKTQRQQQRS